MQIFESHYWKLVVILQKLSGIWVYKDDWKNYVSWFYLYFFTLSFIISMMKLICALVAEDWKTIIDSNELKVMHKYADYGRKVIAMHSGFMISSVFIFLSLPITTPLLDYIIPIENVTRPKILPYHAEYGIDQQKYYYPLIAQAIFGGVGTIMIFVCFDVTFMMVVQHVVTLFAVVNYRLLKVSKISESIENCTVDILKGYDAAYYCTIAAINLHQTALRFVELIESSYYLPCFVVLFVNTSMVGAGLATILLKIEDRPEESVRYIAVLISGLIHFYYLMLPGQKIINISTAVFDTCYASKWYNLSGKSKTLINIMMIRSLRYCQLTGGKMFIICMDTYCNMMKTGFSIFTVLKL